MSWKRYFTPVTSGASSPLTQTSKTKFTRTNYSSYLPDVYSGHPNRLERYAQYDTMDLDPEVNAAFDILSEFCTQSNEENGTPFQIFFKEQATSTEVKIVKKYLQQWCKLNNFHTRIFKIVRNTFKYGDCFFVRDPETQAWFYVDPSKVDKIIVNESEGKKPEQYVIRDLNVNFENLTVTQINPSNQNTTPGGTTYVTGGVHQRGMVGAYPQSSGSRFSINQNQWAINAEHVVHISLSEGLDNNFPFGNSLMETIFKVYKQKELLEDAIIIYRVQRAPERRVFYIDVGNMPSHLAMSFVERVKNEVNQRRIPSLTGGGQSVVDSGFNPLAINEDYFFPQTCSTLDTKIKLLDGRDLELQEIIQEYDQGKENWVYAINQDTHVIEPGKIVWAGKTRLNTQVVEVLLDNGEKIKVTPDHRFIMRDGSEVEAQHLKQGDSVMPLYLHDATTGKHQHAGKYLRYTCNATGKQKWVHTMVCPKSVPGRNTEIHHIDFNSLNNNPSNLVEMNTVEHRNLHKNAGTYHLSSAWKDPVKRASLIAGIRKYHSSITKEDQTMFARRGKINGASTWANQESANKVRRALGKTRQIVSQRKTVVYSDAMCQRLCELYNQGYDSITKLKILQTDEKFQEAFKEANQNLLRDKNRPFVLQVTDTNLNKMARHMGYAGWHDFKKLYACNHQVVSVTWLDQREDTGDITVKSASGAHNFALTAGVFIHNSEGRGSKIDVLPGGCLAMDTVVPLEDGRKLTLTELAAEHQQGKVNWSYSTDPQTGKVVPGLISWAGVTQKSAKVMKLTFNNGQSLICTPDHKFPILAQVSVAASDLKVGQQLIPYDGQGLGNRMETAAPVILVAADYLDDPIEVGTLTIDHQELYHSYHNFALDIGIFTNNSNLGEIDDLLFFTQKMMRALRIPSSYLPTGVDDSQAMFSDGKVGTAYIQELRFNNYCIRLQNLMRDKFDSEFKQYLIKKGMNIDTNLFDIKFNNPQNFASSRQAEMDGARINSFGTISTIPFLSKRFVLKRFLGLSAEEIAENEKLWNEENGSASAAASQNDLRDAGITPGGLSSDLSQFGQSDVGSENIQTDTESPMPGPVPTETQPPAGGGTPGI